MQNPATNSLLDIRDFSLKLFSGRNIWPSAARLYQAIDHIALHNRGDAKLLLQELGILLIRLAEGAAARRDSETLDTFASVLISPLFPAQVQRAGHFYRAIGIRRRHGEETSRDVLERLTEEGDPVVRAKALIAVGSISREMGRLAEAYRIHGEATRILDAGGRFDPVTQLQLRRGIAVIQSVDRNNRGALTTLEHLYPLARAVGLEHPAIWFDYLNSFAVELMENGRLLEAAEVGRRVAASPAAVAFPEWRETYRDILERSRRPSPSTISTGGTESSPKIVAFQDAHQGSDASPAATLVVSSTRPVDLVAWKKKKVSNDVFRSETLARTLRNIAGMSTGQKRSRMVELLYSDLLSDSDLRLILEVVADLLRAKKPET